MKYLKTIYVYRYDEKMHSWSKRQIENVLVSGRTQSYNLSDTLNRDANVFLRVVGNDSADVLPQDLISLCDNEGNRPPDNAFVVLTVVKNRRGSERVRHTKIVCR